ncbi:MAG: adenylyltransferase/cytidyltransferase family protein [Acidobacteria bacterium]|jgi:rfaE bifunctional protein nucleotidyltransferase chain/domain|nr:adenylyltransferase/cytidyltransferase family protein [Acidobacteriota bacterium]
MSLNKFFPLEKLADVLVEQRKKNKKIALANGGFDLVHIGHVRYLKGAKETADILVVALNSDNSLKRLKGDHRAVLDQQSRIRIIAAFECVDYVTIFDELTVDHVILTLKPDIHCKGSDYTVDTVPERETVKSYGGTIAIVGGDKIRSTSHIINDIRTQDS